MTGDNSLAHAHLGKYFLDQGQLDRARDHFGEAVRIQPDAADYQYFLGVAYLSLGRNEEAAGQFLQALRRGLEPPTPRRGCCVVI